MPGGKGADIGVTLSESSIIQFAEVVEDLKIGDKF